eukprot:scaffold3224_cov16-Tisochrysis_lutea.AAC.1
MEASKGCLGVLGTRMHGTLPHGRQQGAPGHALQRETLPVTPANKERFIRVTSVIRKQGLIQGEACRHLCTKCCVDSRPEDFASKLIPPTADRQPSPCSPPTRVLQLRGDIAFDLTYWWLCMTCKVDVMSTLAGGCGGYRWP